MGEKTELTNSEQNWQDLKKEVQSILLALHDLQQRAVSRHPHGRITSRSFNSPINLLTGLQRSQSQQLGCLSKSIKNFQPTSAWHIWQMQDPQPGRWGCTVALHFCTWWILQSPEAAIWINTALLLTHRSLQSHPAVFPRELWSTIISFPQNAAGHIIARSFQDSERSFKKQLARCCVQPLNTLSSKKAAFRESLCYEGLLTALGGESGRLLCKNHCLWCRNHCFKRHSLLTEIPIAWNEEILACIVYLCKNLGSVKKHLPMEIKWSWRWVILAKNSPPANLILWSDWLNKSLELNHWKKNLSQHLEWHKTADADTNEKSSTRHT